jgi:hypothetical protein
MSELLTSNLLLEQLKNRYTVKPTYWSMMEEDMQKAIDEIERLDADAACEKAEKESLKLEIERLRAALADAEANYTRWHQAFMALLACTEGVERTARRRQGNETTHC